MNCPNCQTANPAGARFCHNCGASLAGPRPIEGERRFITVLFADVVGSTGIGERLDPEQVTEIMNEAFAIFNAAVARYGGTVSRLMGDAVLALFGAPAAHEDDPERAVRAGLEIAEAAKEFGRRVERAYGVGFDVRVGINSGLAVLAFVGDELKTEYTAMGDTTNVAARLQSAAEPGSVLISAETYQLVRPIFEFAPRGPIEVKGKAAPIETYEVIAPKAVPGRTRGLEGFTSPLVGRDRELDELCRKLEEVQAGQGAWVALIGEAGLGKSRLVAELQQQALAPPRAVTWLEARAISYGQSTTHYLWQQLLRNAIGAREDDSAELVRQKLWSACDDWGVPESVRPFLEAILAVESPASLEALANLEGGGVLGGMNEAVRAFLRGIAQKPTVIVFDDVHWADAPSLELLLRVSDVIESHPLLLLCLLRPDKDAPSWQTIEHVQEQLGPRCFKIALEPLAPEHSRRLLGSLLEIEDLPEQVRGLILSKSEGNPFFLEEVIRSLVASGHIVRENGYWRARPEIANVTIPDTLTALLSARIDQLAADTKRVLQSASVIGRTFAQRVLQAMYASQAGSIQGLETHLSTLTYEELVRELGRDPEIEYMFKHALTQEAAYNLLLMRRRKELHREVGEVLEQLYPGRLEELAPTLEHHFWQGDDWQRAARYALRAGARAEKVYAVRDATEHYERAYEALVRSPAVSPQELYDAILAWTPVAFRFRSPEQVLEKLAEAEKIARDLQDKPRLAKALVWIGNVHFLTGFRSRGMEALLEGQQLARELGDERLTILPTFILTSVLVDENPGTALEPLADIIELARKHRLREVESHALATRAEAHARVGESEQALEYIRRALEVVPTANSQIMQADVEMAVGMAYFDLGDVERALEYGQMGTQRALSARGLECACSGFFSQGVMHLQTQNTAEALKALQEALALSEFSMFQELRNRARTTLALAQVLTGRPEALQDAERGLADARAMGDQFGVASISHGLGDVHIQLGNLERAAEYLGAALDFYRDKNMPPYLARVLQSLANLHEKQGRLAEAEQARAEAQQLRRSLTPAARSA